MGKEDFSKKYTIIIHKSEHLEGMIEINSDDLAYSRPHGDIQGVQCMVEGEKKDTILARCYLITELAKDIDNLNR